MRRLVKIYYQLANLSILLLALVIIVIHFVTLSYGFYFTGDTITFFVPAFPGHKGDLLAILGWFYPSFPPFVSFVFNFFRFLPISFISQHHLYVFTFTALSTIMAYIIAGKMTPARKWQIILVSLLLFTGSQSLLFLTALSEPLFIFLWLGAIFSIERFMSVKKERYLLLFILFASLMPITRYIGFFVVLSMEIVVIFFAFFVRKEKKFSLSLLLTSLILVWVPILMTMIRNHLLAQSFFGHFDRQFQPMLEVLGGLLGDFSNHLISYRDLILILILSPIIGVQIKWSKPLKNIFILSSISSLLYYLNLIIILTNYRNEQALPFRYFAVGYPILILTTVCLGSFLRYKFPKVQKLSTAGLIIAILIFGRELTFSLNRFFSETKSPQSVITGGANIHAGAEHSSDIRRFCRGKTPNKFLLIQESSRNWVAQSLNFYCLPIEVIPTKQESFKLPKGSLIYSPYKITNSKIVIIEVYKGVKQVILYESTDEVLLDIAVITKNLQMLD